MAATLDQEQVALQWRFANATLDEARGTLCVGGQEVTIQRLPLDVLRTLLRHAGEVVTKDELAEAVWTRKIVDDAVITKAVGKLRAALGDNTQAIIKTVHGVGYRLVADVAVDDARRHTPRLNLNLHAGDHPPLREHWVLERCLGAGGYGEAWLAEHRHTHERRVFKFAADGVALTALKREVTLYRLLREALGPRRDIQPLLDWNLTEHPYFVEQGWQPAGSLLQWAERAGGLAAIPLEQRLELIAQVAVALAAAHGVGVLHKDLKPANIIIDDSGEQTQALLSDFGSGQVIDEAHIRELGITRLGFTRTQQADVDSTTGTPLYLAPEVLAGRPLTLKSDVFALGVMLYQCVVGDFGRPIAPGWTNDIDDPILQQDIADCVDGDPARRLGDPAALAERLRKLDTRRAAARQAQAERARAAALEKHLQQVRQRRRFWASVAGVSVLGLGVSLWFFQQARLAQASAETAAAAAVAESTLVEQMNRFLVEDLIGGADFNRNGAPDLTVAEAIDAGQQRVDTRFGDQPVLAARLRGALASAQYALGNYEAAMTLNTQALETLQARPTAAPKTLVDAMLLQSSLHDHLGDYTAAINILDEGLSRPQLLRADGLEPDVPVLFRLHLAQRLLKLGKHDAALMHIRAAEAMVPGLPDEFRQVSAWELFAAKGGLHYGQGALREAAESFRRAINAGHAAFGARDPRVVSVELDLAAALTRLGEHGQAIAQVDASQGALRAAFDPGSFMPLKAALWKGRAQLGAGQAEDAVQTLEQASQTAHAGFGPESMITLVLQIALADAWIAVADAERAHASLDPVRGHLQRALGPDVFARHTARFAVDASHCRLLALRKDWARLHAQARPLLQDAMTHQAPGHPTVVDIALSLAEAEQALGNPEAAAQTLARAEQMMQGNPKAFGGMVQRAQQLRERLAAG